MAQYDDPQSPSATPTGAPDRSADANWLSRPSLDSRRRNQWRQYKHMTPDFGVVAEAERSPTAAAPSPSPLPPAREAALPSFSVKPGGSVPPPTPERGRAGMGDLNSSPPPPHRPLQMHPHSSASVPLPTRPPVRPAAPASPAAPTVASPTAKSTPGSRPGSSGPSNVTPLRPRLTRSASPVPGGTAALGVSSGRPAASAQRSGGGRSRQFSPQRRLAKLPPPVLYVIRLAILGIGVAALAGTLLSVLSPSNVASSGDDTAAISANSRTPDRDGVARGGAITLADLRPTSELTRLKAQLEQLALLTPGLTPVLYALDVDSGRYVDLGGSESIAAASTIKVPILVAFLQQVDAGNLALNQALILQDSHMAGGAGTMANDPVGSEYPALEVATRMIVNSDNTATNLLIDALGGMEALNQQVASWGLESTVLRNPLPDLDGTNTTSTRDLALLMALADQGTVLSPRSRDRLLSIMQRTVNRSLIAFSITDGSLISNKTGDIASALGDMALIDTPNGNRYVLAVMVQRPNNDGRASELIRRLTETTHTEMNQPIAPVGRTNAPPPREQPSSGPDGSTTPVVVPLQPNSADPSAEPAPNPSGDAIPPG